jgi:23S rRNA pseudouridine2605 synthase
MIMIKHNQKNVAEKKLERLHKVLAQAGLGSRRNCEALIISGRVVLDGKRVTEVGQVVDPDKCKIFCDGEPIKRQNKVYYLLNKPRGYVCTNEESSRGFRVIDLLRSVDQRIYTIGRLDKESEGLILLTNDGELANLLSHPRYGIEKRYRAEVKGRVNDETLETLRQGMWLSDGKMLPSSVKAIHRRYRTSTLEIVLREGKNREIRRLLAKTGHNVISLRRVKIGHLEAESSLKSGKFRPLLDSEIKRLYMQATSCKRATPHKPKQRDGKRCLTKIRRSHLSKVSNRLGKRRNDSNKRSKIK